MKEKLVILSGAGISAESGLKTFRDAGGLWEGYDVMRVASIDGWHQDPDLVLEFYNMRRAQLKTVEPNGAHKIITELEAHFDVRIITQNVDDLHERAGSTNIIHLHGELVKARSTEFHYPVYNIGYENIRRGDLCERGTQLRPHIVWFGEAVPMIEQAALEIADASIVIVIGTSMQVYPAAGLIGYAPKNARKWYIDPNAEPIPGISNLTVKKTTAVAGMEELKEELIALL